jgi:8-hydroxy-5-deazaflavin:NADPH oxidoreductase
MNSSPILSTIAVLGGTGKEGKGLAYRWAKAGYRVLIGSRSPDKAKATALEILGLLGGKVFVEGTTNARAADLAEIVVLAVPYSGHRDTLEGVRESLQGKILVDVTVPLVPPKVTRVQMPPAGSAAQEAYALLGPDVQVTSAFQNISHELLMHPEPIECDVLVTGTSKEARLETLKLVQAAGLVGWDAGPIENSVVIEGLTSVLIHLNRESGSRNAGIKITGIRSGSKHFIAI